MKFLAAMFRGVICFAFVFAGQYQVTLWAQFPTPPQKPRNAGSPQNSKIDPGSKKSNPFDGREAAWRSASERYTMTPMVVQPSPRPLEPLDLQDEKAVLYELAELASFEYHREGDTDSTINGVGRGSQIFPIDGIEQMRRAMRFDRLQKSPDRDIREIAAKVRAISEDVYRLNRANHDYGLVYGLEEYLRLKGLAFPTMAAFAHWNQLESASEQAWTEERLPDGRIARHFDEARFRELSSRPSALAGLFQMSGESVKANVENELKQRKLMASRTGALRGLLQERMALIWRESLLRRIEKLSGPELDKPPVELGPPPMNTKAPPPLFGSIRFQNRSGRELQHSTLAVKLKDDLGQESEWYCHFAVLETRKYFDIIYPNGSRNIVPGSANSIDGSFSYLSDRGRLLEQPIKLDSKRSTPLSEARREKIAQAIAANRKEDDLRRSEEQEMMKALRALYPAVQNPETGRERLLKAIGKNRRFQTTFYVSQKQVPAKLELEQMAPDSKEWKATLEVAADDKDEKYALMGRIADEPNRGSVLAFVHIEGEAHETKPAREVAERIAKVSGQYKGAADVARELASRTEKLSKLRLERWKKGGLPLITSPSEYFAKWEPELLVLSGKNKVDLQRAISDFVARRKQFEFASDVLYLDSQGVIWWQHLPFAGKREELVFAPLTPR